MKTSGALQPNDELEFTIKITGPVADWKALIKQCEAMRQTGWYAWPLSTILSQVKEIMDRLDVVYYGKTGSTDGDNAP